jgi:hypothetical protein
MKTRQKGCYWARAFVLIQPAVCDGICELKARSAEG